MAHRRAGSPERRHAAMRVVDELIRHGELAWAERRVDRADGVDRDARAHTALLERPEIRPIVDLVRREMMLLAVPRNTRHARAVHVQRQHCAARLAVRRLRRASCEYLETEALEAAADDEGEWRHARSATA